MDSLKTRKQRNVCSINLEIFKPLNCAALLSLGKKNLIHCFLQDTGFSITENIRKIHAVYKCTCMYSQWVK